MIEIFLIYIIIANNPLRIPDCFYIVIGLKFIAPPLKEQVRLFYRQRTPIRPFFTWSRKIAGYFEIFIPESRFLSFKYLAPVKHGWQRLYLDKNTFKIVQQHWKK
jgi:hypothetical protein